MGNATIVQYVKVNQEQRRVDFLEEVIDEVDRAYAKHGKEQWGRHEFYGIIKEEFDEMWQAIMDDNSQELLRREIIHVAAMCLRYLETGDRYRERTED